MNGPGAAALGLGFAAACALGLAARADAVVMADALTNQLHQGVTVERYVAAVLEPLRRADRGNDGLDAADIELMDREAAAQTRGGFASNFFRYDLDGDLKVTLDEVARVSRLSGPSQARLPSDLDRFDANDDGVLEFRELLASFGRVQAPGRQTWQVRQLMELAPARDGRLTAAELRAVAESTFNAADTDGDAMLSAEEATAFRKLHPPPPPPPPEVYCALPQPAPKAKIVLVGAYEGAPQTATPAPTAPVAGGRRARAIGEATLHIEAGREPLFVVVTSYEPIHWRFAGATSRLAAVVVVNGYGEAVADVSGVAPPVLQRRRANGCIPHFYDLTSASSQQARAAVQSALGRPADVVFGGYRLTQAYLPSGALEPPAAAVSR